MLNGPARTRQSGPRFSTGLAVQFRGYGPDSDRTFSCLEAWYKHKIFCLQFCVYIFFGHRLTSKKHIHKAFAHLSATRSKLL